MEEEHELPPSPWVSTYSCFHTLPLQQGMLCVLRRVCISPSSPNEQKVPVPRTEETKCHKPRSPLPPSQLVIPKH